MSLDFGWVIQPVPHGDLETTDLHEYNRRAIAALPPQFTTLWMEDHLQWQEKPLLEAWTTLTYLAAEFPQYRFANMVLGQSYRNPALLAKMGATLQQLTGGRFTMGIGAGWKEDEYRAYGYEFPGAGVRVDQLIDTIQIMRAMWTQSPATYHGKRYHIEDAYCAPRPDPAIPILVGGNGDRILRATARLADAWNFATFSGTVEVMREKLATLKRLCAEVGRDFGAIQLTYYGVIHLPDDPADFKGSKGFQVLGPTSQDAITQLQPFIDLGVTHILLRTQNIATLQRFGVEVAPALASA